jgi:hypothetical protein
MFHWNRRGCRKYQIRMEDCVGAAHTVEVDPDISAHLAACQECRDAFAAAQLSVRLFSESEEPAVPSRESFVTRVMALVREEDALQESTARVWRPLEDFASRFALVASLGLLALSVFLGEFAPALRQAEAVSTGAVTAEISSDWPEPPAQPATQDEVLMSLVDMDNGI